MMLGRCFVVWWDDETYGRSSCDPSFFDSVDEICGWQLVADKINGFVALPSSSTTNKRCVGMLALLTRKDNEKNANPKEKMNTF